MKRNIVITIGFASGHISLNAIETLLGKNKVEIYSAQDSISKAHPFLSRSLEELSILVGGNIHSVVVTIEESEKLDPQIEITKVSLNLATDLVTKQDVDNIINLAKQKNSKPNREITLVQPINFDLKLKDGVNKSYSKVPLHRPGESLSATLATTSINKDVLDFINQVLKAHKLIYSQILLKSQAISQNNLSEHALEAGAILIHIGENQSFVTINKNYGTVAQISFYEVGFKKLINGVAKVFDCENKQARELVSIYGNLLAEENRVIYSNQKGIKETNYTLKELTEIITAFIRRLLAISDKFIRQMEVTGLPIIFSGELTKVKNFIDFAKTIFPDLITVYKPMTFIEINKFNHPTLGFIN